MKRAIVIALALVLGCSANRPVVFGERVPKGCGETATSVDDERCVEFFVDQFLRLLMYESYEDPAVARYVAAVGNRLAHASGVEKRPWKFVILDDDDANAFVTMGSTVYLHRGTLAALRSEAELAAILAHEMGHLLGGHARERWADIVRDAPRSAAQRMLQNRYARDDEIQADEHAVLLLAKAGYDTRAVTTMLRALAGTTDYDATESPDAVHPWWPERIARALALTAIRVPDGELGETRYRTGLATLTAGRDPRREAAVVGNAVVFAKAMIAIDLPAGKIVHEDGWRKVAIDLPDGTRAEFVAIPASMMSFLKWITSDGGAYEIVTAGGETLLISLEGKDAKARVRALRAGIRAARPDEIAQIRPTYVSFDLPRRLWTR